MRRVVVNPQNWPITVKVPLVVAIFLIVVSALITKVVLDRLSAIQERNLASLTTVYLDGVESAILPNVMREDPWEVFDALDRSASFDTGFGRALVIVVNPGGAIIASSDPRNFPTNKTLPDEIRREFSFSGLAVDAKLARADVRRPLIYQGRAVGEVFARVDISNLLRERRSVLITLIFTNAGIAFFLALLAYLAVQRMMAPIVVLSTHLDHGIVGLVGPIPDDLIASQNVEFCRLFRRFNAMAAAVSDRESFARKLATEEKLASLGRLASSMAHEINNPLGGLFNALDTLRRHGENSAARDRAFSLLQRGLAHIRDVVRAALVTYRSKESPRSLTSADIDDLRLLVEPEAIRRGAKLTWANDIADEVPVPAGNVRQTVLNLLLNACSASAPGSTVHLKASNSDCDLVIDVGDEGPGLPPELVDYLVASGGEHPPPVGGLGLWIVRRLVIESGGSISLVEEPNMKTIIRVVWPFSITNLEHLSSSEEVAFVR
jgi:signal transduction histidine kinase